MSRLVLLLSFIVILSAHTSLFLLKFEKKEIVVNPVKYSKVSVQLAQVKKPKPLPIIKPIEDLVNIPVEKLDFKPIPIIKKPIFKKPIKKEAKRELVKKVKKKKIKKKPKKKIIKKKKPKKIVKRIKKKQVKKKIKKIVKKTIVQEVKAVETKTEKIIKNAPVKKVKNPSNKNATKSLQKFRRFKRNYLSDLRSAIDRNKKYPRASKRLNEQGKVVVSFRVYKSGRFENIKILQSSGKKRLDKAALKAVEKTRNFKAFDSSIKKEFMDITVPIRFQITQ